MTRFLIVGGLVVLVMLGLGGLWLVAHLYNKATSERPPSEEAVHAAQIAVINFLDDLRDSGAASAYQWTSQDYQSRQSLEQFQAWVDRYPQLKGREKTITAKPGGKARSVRFEVALANLKLLVTVVKEDNEWKVDAISTS